MAKMGEDKGSKDRRDDDRKGMDKHKRADDIGGKSIGDKDPGFKSKSVSKGDREDRNRDFPSKKPEKRESREKPSKEYKRKGELDRKDTAYAGGKKPKRAAEIPGKEGKMDAPRKGESKSRADSQTPSTPVSCSGCGASMLGAIALVVVAVLWIGGLIG